MFAAVCTYGNGCFGVMLVRENHLEGIRTGKAVCQFQKSWVRAAVRSEVGVFWFLPLAIHRAHTVIPVIAAYFEKFCWLFPPSAWANLRFLSSYHVATIACPPVILASVGQSHTGNGESFEKVKNASSHWRLLCMKNLTLPVSVPKSMWTCNIIKIRKDFLKWGSGLVVNTFTNNFTNELFPDQQH